MTTTRFQVPRMDCATEKEMISRRLASVGGIAKLEFDLLDRVVIVQHAEESTAVATLAALRDIDMAPVRLDGGAAARPVAGDDHDHDAPGHVHATLSATAVPPLPVANMRREYALLALSGLAALARS